MGKLRREHERRPLSLDTHLGHEVAQEVAEVNVEELSALVEHDVVAVAIADADDVRCDTVAAHSHRKVPPSETLLLTAKAARPIAATHPAHDLANCAWATAYLLTPPAQRETPISMLQHNPAATSTPSHDALVGGQRWHGCCRRHVARSRPAPRVCAATQSAHTAPRRPDFAAVIGRGY